MDLSRTYLDWAGRNMSANGFTGPQHKFVRSDAMKFLREHPTGEAYDIAVVDPPSFSNSKRTEGIFDVQRDYAELLNAVASLTPAGGVIYFSTNLRRFQFDPTALPNLETHDISRQTVPEDFRNKRTHHCQRIVVK